MNEFSLPKLCQHNPEDWNQLAAHLFCHVEGVIRKSIYCTKAIFGRTKE